MRQEYFSLGYLRLCHFDILSGTDNPTQAGSQKQMIYWSAKQ